MKRSQRGVALLIVLWVMTILIVTVLSFSLMTRSETYGTLTYKDRMEKKYLAEAGIERGIAEMINYSRNTNQTVTVEGDEWRTDGTAYNSRMADGSYVVRIFDESGKISLNGLTDASGVIVRNLLVNLGSPASESDTIVDSLLDWKDGDDLHRLNGAENDYYQSLPHPYRAKNADFDSLEELLLVRGVTPDILYGTDTRKGLIQFITLYNTTNRINVMVASREVLAALPGMDAAIADRIVEFRNSAAMRGTMDIMTIIGGPNVLAAPYVSAQAGGTPVCTIAATGYKESEKNGYSVTATVELDKTNKYRYLYYSSPSGM
jgi:general secretion pathway protein K